jgi:hypothetical protein
MSSRKLLARPGISHAESHGTVDSSRLAPNTIQLTTD